ncbi:hypothetical protein CCICO_00170 [Corynebacterium ciconiae DSM 44920]|nr:hypothetical protein CCICO_00170 [Corynebacterium ciconiae DSM 44920]
MSWELLSGGILGVCCFVYVLVALLQPERFS